MLHYKNTSSVPNKDIFACLFTRIYKATMTKQEFLILLLELAMALNTKSLTVQVESECYNHIGTD